MRKIFLVYILLFICADLLAQNYYLRSLDLDTGFNMIRNAYLNKQSKEITIVSSTYLLDTSDAYNKYVLKTHFNKLDTLNNISLDKSFILINSSFRSRGTIKLLQGGYLSYGLYYDSKLLKNKLAGIPGCIIRFAENGDTLFIKKYPFRKDVSEISSLVQLKDSSFISVCSLSDTNGSFTILTGLRVLKLNKDFSTAWDSLYYYSDGSDISIPRVMGYIDAIIQTPDKGFLVGFGEYTKTADTTHHSVLFKIDSIGKLLWEKKYYGNDDYSNINRIISLRDGNYLLMGNLSSYFLVDPKVTDFVTVIKVNGLGNVIWKKLIGKFEYQYILDVNEFPNGNILLAGQSDVRGNTHVYDMKASLICLNENGVLIWDRQYKIPSNSTYDEINDVYFADIEIAYDNSILGVGNYATANSTFPYNNGFDLDLLFFHADSLGCINPGTCPFTEIENIPKEPNYIYVYPNPSSNFIGFKSNLTASSGLHVKIINSIGQIVVEKTLLDFNETIDISSIASGIYFVEMKTDDVVVTQKIFIE